MELMPQYQQEPKVIQQVHPKGNLYARYGKRTLDLMMCVLLIIPCLCLFPVISLLIILESRGPVFFLQPRIGWRGKEFQIIKFRTMYADVPNQGRSPHEDGDPRITKVGRILRKTSLDELPQIINILKGEMSFIGPRPEQKMIVEQVYTGYERLRFLVKPGITGLWQVSPDRTKPIHENLHHDLYYIQNISFALDLKIVWKTILVMFKSNTH
ncbi:sugar transferase [Brevibacillus migulae]|uniref:sugar transferase n=1 Tax=Brevibacillus migulae TaxID=1644114 RepID=UPI00106E70C4|nr:sugar transferase [Brevibacillus migulae]